MWGFPASPMKWSYISQTYPGSTDGVGIHWLPEIIKSFLHPTPSLTWDDQNTAQCRDSMGWAHVSYKQISFPIILFSELSIHQNAQWMPRSRDIFRNTSQTYLTMEPQNTFLETQLRLWETTGKDFHRIVTQSYIWNLERPLQEQCKGRVVGDPKIGQRDHLRGNCKSPDGKS